jgi:hypothetical protein
VAERDWHASDVPGGVCYGEVERYAPLTALGDFPHVSVGPYARARCKECGQIMFAGRARSEPKSQALIKDGRP